MAAPNSQDSGEFYLLLVSRLLLAETACCLPQLAGEQGGGGAGAEAGQWRHPHLEQGGHQLEQAGEDRGVTEPISPAIKGLSHLQSSVWEIDWQDYKTSTNIWDWRHQSTD